MRLEGDSDPSFSANELNEFINEEFKDSIQVQQKVSRSEIEALLTLLNYNKAGEAKLSNLEPLIYSD